MIISNFRVEPADYNADFADLRAIREAVFVVEQHIPENIEFDVIDRNCYHFIARDDQHQAIGTGRLSPDNKIGRTAVLESWRNKGVGKALLLAILEKARKLGVSEVTIDAQINVVPFYEKFNFLKSGNIFTVADIPHQTMHLSLEPLAKPSRPELKPREALVEIAELTSQEDTVGAVLQLIGKARRQICIYTPDLEPLLYGKTEVLEALKQFAINSSGGLVMIILQDTLAARNQPHALIDLVQRLPSTFFLRTPTEADDLQYPSAYLLNDRDGYLFRQRSNHMHGVWSPNMPARNRQLTGEFDTVWQRCRPCTEFRALGL